MQTAPPDPFGLSSDPRAYVARAATEAALDRLEEAILAGSPVVHLHGPPGIGKTLLLHVLRQRLEGRFRFVYLPYPRMEPGGLWLWVGSALGIAASLDARRGMRRLAAQAHAAGGALVLMVDEAGMLPGASLRDLVAAARSEPGLQVVLASLEADDLAHALEPGTPEVRLTQPMSLDETGRYVRARLARRDAPEALLARFDDRVMAWLQRESGGIPLLVHALADAVARGQGTAAPEPTAAPEAAERAPAMPAPEDGEPAPPLTRVGARRGRAPRRPRASRRGLAVAVAALVGLGLGLLAEPFTGLGHRLLASLQGGPRAQAPVEAERPTPAALPAVGAPPPPQAATAAPGSGPAGAQAPPPVASAPPAAAEAEAATRAEVRTRGLAEGAEPVETPAELAQPTALPPAASDEGLATPSEVQPPAEVARPAPAPALAQAPPPEAEAAPREDAPSPAALPPVAAAPPAPQPPAAPAPEPAAEPAPPPAPAARRAPRAIGLLRVEAPEGVLVTVDGRLAGPAPVEPLALPQGTHQVRVRQRDGTVAQRTVELGEDATVVFYPPEDEGPDATAPPSPWPRVPPARESGWRPRQDSNLRPPV